MVKDSVAPPVEAKKKTLKVGFVDEKSVTNNMIQYKSTL